MNRFGRRAALTAAALAGIAAAIALTIPASASAWYLNQLPDGYFVSSYQTICHTNTDPCVDGEGSTCNHVTIHAGSYVWAETDCVNPTFQDDLNHFIDSTICTINPVAGQANGECLPATTTGDTTAPDTTAGTTNQDTTTQDNPTVPTVTVTQTVAVVIVDPTINQRLAALEAEYAALAARVDAIAEANTASWTAFLNAIDAGASISDAALAARSAGLNAIYELG